MRIQTTQQINYQSQNFSDQSLYTMVTSDDLVQEFPLDSDSNMINLIVREHCKNSCTAVQDVECLLKIW